METERDIEELWMEIQSNMTDEYKGLSLAEISKELSKALQDDGPRYNLHPKQKIFLEKLKENVDNVYVLTEQDNLCIAHCLKYEHYSELHRETLNKLIKKYVRRNEN